MQHKIGILAGAVVGGGTSLNRAARLE